MLTKIFQYLTPILQQNKEISLYFVGHNVEFFNKVVFERVAFLKSIKSFELINDSFVSVDINETKVDKFREKYIATQIQALNKEELNVILNRTVIMPLEFTSCWGPSAPFDFISTNFALETKSKQKSFLFEQLRYF